MTVTDQCYCPTITTVNDFDQPFGPNMKEQKQWVTLIWYAHLLMAKKIDYKTAQEVDELG